MIPGGIPKDHKELLRLSLEVIEQCNVSVGMRSA